MLTNTACKLAGRALMALAAVVALDRRAAPALAGPRHCCCGEDPNARCGCTGCSLHRTGGRAAPAQAGHDSAYVARPAGACGCADGPAAQVVSLKSPIWAARAAIARDERAVDFLPVLSFLGAPDAVLIPPDPPPKAR